MSRRRSISHRWTRRDSLPRSSLGALNNFCQRYSIEIQEFFGPMHARHDDCNARDVEHFFMRFYIVHTNKSRDYFFRVFVIYRSRVKVAPAFGLLDRRESRRRTRGERAGRPRGFLFIYRASFSFFYTPRNRAAFNYVVQWHVA